MWQIIHWYFMYYISPNPCMHVAAAAILGSYAQLIDDKLSRRDIVSSIGLIMVYIGVYIDANLAHFAYQPWWVVSVTGIRNHECIIFVGGIITGVYLLLTTYPAIIAHVMINVGQLIRIRRISFKARAIVHMACIFIHASDPNLDKVQYRDFLMGISAALCGFIKTNPDWISLGFVFSSRVALTTFIIHALEPNWWKFYRNNHFKIVKGSYYFIYPVVIVLLAFGYNVTKYVNVADAL